MLLLWGSIVDALNGAPMGFEQQIGPLSQGRPRCSVSQNQRLKKRTMKYFSLRPACMNMHNQSQCTRLAGCHWDSSKQARLRHR